MNTRHHVALICGATGFLLLAAGAFKVSARFGYLLLGAVLILTAWRLLRRD